MKRKLGFTLLLFHLLAGNTYSQLQYVKDYGSNGNSSWGSNMERTFDNGYILTSSKVIDGYDDFYVIKVNSQGDTMWAKTYGGPTVDYMRYITQTSDSGYIATGVLDFISNNPEGV